MRIHAVIMAGALLTACAGGPVGNRAVPQPVKAVDLRAYVGRWYEYARYENRFERGCEGVTAEYAPRNDGGVTGAEIELADGHEVGDEFGRIPLAWVDYTWDHKAKLKLTRGEAQNRWREIGGRGETD
jgi:hypothetical protein